MARAEFRAALQEYQRLVHEYPSDPKYSQYLTASPDALGNLLAQQGKPAEAVAEFRAPLQEQQRLADAHPNNLQYRKELAFRHNHLAWLLATSRDLRLRDPGQALRHAKEAIELAPGDGMILNTLGVAQYRNGAWQSAIEDLKKSAQLRKGATASISSSWPWRTGS
jgi:tetratricopeptide (TPR) repeat protein